MSLIGSVLLWSHLCFSFQYKWALAFLLGHHNIALQSSFFNTYRIIMALGWRLQMTYRPMLLVPCPPDLCPRAHVRPWNKSTQMFARGTALLRLSHNLICLSCVSSECNDVICRYFGCGLVIPEKLEGCAVLDLGSGSGRDCYVISKLVGERGQVIGLDMTDEMVLHTLILTYFVKVKQQKIWKMLNDLI